MGRTTKKKRKKRQQGGKNKDAALSDLFKMLKGNGIDLENADTVKLGEQVMQLMKQEGLSTTRPASARGGYASESEASRSSYAADAYHDGGRADKKSKSADLNVRSAIEQSERTREWANEPYLNRSTRSNQTEVNSRPPSAAGSPAKTPRSQRPAKETVELSGRSAPRPASAASSPASGGPRGFGVYTGADAPNLPPRPRTVGGTRAADFDPLKMAHRAHHSEAVSQTTRTVGQAWAKTPREKGSFYSQVPDTPSCTQYAQPNYRIKSAGAAEFSKTPARVPLAEQQHIENPGPGAYTPVPVIKEVQKKPNGTIAVAAAPPVFLPGATTPGPGAYHKDTNQMAAGAAKFGTSEARKPLIVQGHPGPGQYDLQKPLSNAGAGPFGRSTARPPLIVQDVPAPGTYSHVDSNLAAGAAKFGTSPARVPLIVQDNPGPGQYFDKSQAGMAIGNAGAGPFARAPREGLYEFIETPGPGEYQRVDSNLGGKGCTFGRSSDPPVHVEDTPGVGSYQIAIPLSNKGMAFAQYEPMPPPVSENPGPGAYHRDINVLTAPGATKFGTAERAPVDHHVQMPGPGAYISIHSNLHTPGAGIFPTSKRPPLLMVTDTPGPGTYGSIHSVLTTPGVTKFSEVVQRPPLIVQDNPGPGTYHQNVQNMTAHGVTKFSEVVQRPPLIVQDNPGPGTYELKASMAAGCTRFGDTVQRPPLIVQDVPGPGTYDTVTRLSTQGAIKFSDVVQRPPLIVQDIPGPGTYNPPGNILEAQGQSFTHAIQRPPLIVQDNPGPGEYHHGGLQLGTAGGSFTKEIQRPPLITQDVPGPGTYDMRGNIVQAEGQSFTRSIQRPPLIVQDIPGPGTYDYMHNFSASAAGAGPFPKATSSFDLQHTSCAPAPNTYNPRLPGHLPGGAIDKAPLITSLTISGEYGTPGPGLYNPHDYTATQTERRNTGSIFGAPSYRPSTNPAYL